MLGRALRDAQAVAGGLRAAVTRLEYYRFDDDNI